MVYVTTPVMTCLWGMSKQKQIALQFTDVENDSSMKSFYNFIKNIEIHNMRNLGITEKDIDKYERDWENHQKYRYFKENSYDFKIETVGVYKNNELVVLACENIIQRLKQIIKQCNDNTLPVEKSVVAMKNSFDIKLINEDYTIGKVVE